MNWLFIIVMAYIVVSALRGFHKGFLRVVYSMVALLITIVFVSISVPLISKVIQERTPIAKSIEAGCRSYLQSAVEERLADGSFGQELEQHTGILAIMPDEFLDNLMKSAGDVVKKSSVINKTADILTDYLVSFLAFVLSTVIIQVILFLIGKKLDLFARIPGIHLANMVMGFCAGIVKAFIVIWTVFLIIQLTAPFPLSAALISLIEENEVLQGLYQQNQLLELLGKLSLLKGLK